MNKQYKRWGILIGVFSIVLAIESYIIQNFGLQPMFNQNIVFAFLGPGLVSAVVYVGIDKYVLRTRVK